jgi:hypothetical protein
MKERGKIVFEQQVKVIQQVRELRENEEEEENKS